MKDFSHLLQFYQEVRNIKVQKRQKDTFHSRPPPRWFAWKRIEISKDLLQGFWMKCSDRGIFQIFVQVFFKKNLNCNELRHFHTHTNFIHPHDADGGKTQAWQHHITAVSIFTISEHLVMSQQESLYPTDTANTFRISRGWKTICSSILLTNKFAWIKHPRIVSSEFSRRDSEEAWSLQETYHLSGRGAHKYLTPINLMFFFSWVSNVFGQLTHYCRKP